MPGNSIPFVCKILDYGKWIYNQNKKERIIKKNQKSPSLKELRFRPNIGKNDLINKSRQLKDFLDAGDSVKINIRYSGRENNYKEIGFDLLKNIVAQFPIDSIQYDKSPEMIGRSLIAILRGKNSE